MMRQSGWRRWIAVFAMLAFALQVQLTQAHIHFAHDFGSTISKSDGTTAKAPSKKNLPANSDPANCPICQAALHGGQFLSPSAVAFALPSEAIAIVPLVVDIVIARDTPSHNWQGRAPPHA